MKTGDKVKVIDNLVDENLGLIDCEGIVYRTWLESYMHPCNVEVELTKLTETVWEYDLHDIVGFNMKELEVI